MTNGAYLMIGDVAALCLALLAAAGTTWFVSEGLLDKPFYSGFVSSLPDRLLVFSGLGIGFMFWAAHKNHYRSRLPMWMELRDITIAIGIIAIMDGFIQYAVKYDFSRLWLLQTWFFAAFFLAVSRVGIKRLLLATGRWHIPTIVLGDGEWAANASRALGAERHLGYRVVDAIEPVSEAAGRPKGVWAQQLTDMWPGHYFVLAPSPNEFATLQDLATELSRMGAPFAIIPPLRWIALSGLEPHQFFSHDVMMLVPRNNLERPLAAFMKRAFDLVASLGLIVVLAPAMALIAWTVKSDKGNAIYAHQRVGRGGRQFKCLKFRSMIQNADAVLETHLRDNPEAAKEWAETHKLKDDPRVTRIGQFLRRTSLDELPQIFNVLIGDMSLVGPRPITKVELVRYGDELPYYLEVRPGITGLWQVSGRNETTYDERVRLDGCYVRNWSLWQDIAILVKTARVLINKRGAY